VLPRLHQQPPEGRLLISEQHEGRLGYAEAARECVAVFGILTQVGVQPDLIRLAAAAEDGSAAELQCGALLPGQEGAVWVCAATIAREDHGPFYKELLRLVEEWNRLDEAQRQDWVDQSRSRSMLVRLMMLARQAGLLPAMVPVPEVSE
jgi:hypothetical protein